MFEDIDAMILEKAKHRASTRRNGMVPIKVPARPQVKAKGKPSKALKPLMSVFKENNFFIRSADQSSGSFVSFELEFGELKPRLRAVVILYPGNKISIEHLNVDPRNYYTSVVEDEISKVPMVNEGTSGAFPYQALVPSLVECQKLHQHNFEVMRKAMDASLKRAADTKLDMLKALAKAVSQIEEFNLQV